MRDLSWFTENYIIVSFIHFDRIKDKKLAEDIKGCLQCWQQYWDNCETYADYQDLHPFGKTVLILFDSKLY